MSHMVVSQVSEFVRHTHWLGLRADPAHASSHVWRR